MKFFIDTAKVEDIKKANDMGVICGVTTNPSLIAKEGRVFEEVIAEIASIVDGPISGEVKATTTDAEGMIKEGREIAKIHPNMVVKIPMTVEGLKACKQLTSEGIKTNVTLIFTANQALLAARAGATYVSPFLGRLDDISVRGVDLIREIAEIFAVAGDIDTQIIRGQHPSSDACDRLRSGRSRHCHSSLRSNREDDKASSDRRRASSNSRKITRQFSESRHRRANNRSVRKNEKNHKHQEAIFMNKLELMKTANEVRKGVITATHSAKSGHPGGSLSAADIFTYLYFEELNIRSKGSQKSRQRPVRPLQGDTRLPDTIQLSLSEDFSLWRI